MAIPIRKTLLFLLAIICILVLMHVLANDLSWALHESKRFNLDAEANIPTWFSAILLFSISICSLLIYMLRSNVLKERGGWVSFWIVVSAVYCFLSLDEVARLHELIDTYTSVKWVYVYAPFAAIFFFACVFYFFAIRNNDHRIGFWFVGGLFLYGAGGLFAEFLSHYFHPLPRILQQLEFMSEEGLEMLGAAMVLMACFTELNALNQTKIRIISRWQE